MNSGKIVFYDGVAMGPPCPFTRDPQTNSHPSVEEQEINGRSVFVCRNCGQEVANQPGLPLLMEPRSDPRVRLVEKDVNQ